MTVKDDQERFVERMSDETLDNLLSGFVWKERWLGGRLRQMVFEQRLPNEKFEGSLRQELKLELLSVYQAKSSNPRLKEYKKKLQRIAEHSEKLIRLTMEVDDGAYSELCNQSIIALDELGRRALELRQESPPVDSRPWLDKAVQHLLHFYLLHSPVRPIRKTPTGPCFEFVLGCLSEFESHGFWAFEMSGSGGLDGAYGRAVKNLSRPSKNKLAMSLV